MKIIYELIIHSVLSWLHVLLATIYSAQPSTKHSNKVLIPI